jgi:hypothetical protein
MDSAAIQEAKQQENLYAKAQITTKIIPSTNNTFGYDILLYGKYDNGMDVQRECMDPAYTE